MIYFDNAATTKPCEGANRVARKMNDLYGNPSSIHHFGIQAETEFMKAKNSIAKAIGRPTESIIFTSGGTEANNMAVLGMVPRKSNKRQTHFITSISEHPSIRGPMEHLFEMGFPVNYIPVDEGGMIDINQLTAAINRHTKLVSIIHVNNETGVIQDIKAIGKAIKETNRLTLFHVDGVQGFLKHPLDLEEAQVDLYTASAHKVHGFKGTGFLVVGENIHLHPLLLGGDQERGIRPGTENILGVMAMGEAVTSFSKAFASESVWKIKEEMSQLTDLPNTFINTLSQSPYILNISFVGIPSEILVNALSAQGIYISAGAACSAKRPHSLDYLPMDLARVVSAVRMSFSQNNQIDEAIKARQIIIETVITLRKQIGG